MCKILLSRLYNSYSTANNGFGKRTVVSFGQKKDFMEDHFLVAILYLPLVFALKKLYLESAIQTSSTVLDLAH